MHVKYCYSQVRWLHILSGHLQAFLNKQLLIYFQQPRRLPWDFPWFYLVWVFFSNYKKHIAQHVVNATKLASALLTLFYKILKSGMISIVLSIIAAIKSYAYYVRANTAERMKIQGVWKNRKSRKENKMEHKGIPMQIDVSNKSILMRELYRKL